MFDRQFFVVLGIFIVLTLVLYYPVILGGKSFGSPDSLNPKSAGIILNQVWEETGEFPLWQPWIFSGMPTTEAFTFISLLYFPAMILKLLFIKGIIAQLFHLIFAGLGGYYLMKYLSKDESVSIMTGLAYMAMPYMTTMVVFGHGSQMMTAAYIPWVFLTTIKLFNKPSITHTGVLAILLGFQLQRAHVQVAYYTWLLIGAYVLWIIVDNIRKKEMSKTFYTSIGYFALSAVLAIGLALIIYYPSLSYSDYSIRGGGATGGADYSYATGWSFHPKEMVTFLIPSAFGFGGSTYWGYMPFTDYPNYMGILVLAFAAIGFARNRSSFTYFLLSTLILALFISFGKHISLIYDLFYIYFPFFSKFRVPAMILMLVQFNTCILAGMGLKSIISDHQFIDKYQRIILTILIAIGAILLLGDGAIRSALQSMFTPPRVQDQRTAMMINEMRENMWMKDAWISLLMIGAVFGGFWALQKEFIAKKVLVIGIVGLVMIDMGIVNWKIIHPGTNSGRHSQLMSNRAMDRHFEKDEVMRYLIQEKEKPFRVYPLGQWFGDTRFRAFGIETVGGYHPAKLKNYNTFLTETNNGGTLPLIRMLNVRYFISPQALNLSGASLAFQGKMNSARGYMNTYVYRLRDDLPRAWFVGEIQSLEDDSQVWKSLSGAAFDPEKTAFVLRANDLSGDYVIGEILSQKYSIHDITLTVRASDTGFLVMSEVNYPLRWKAMLNGNPIETVEVNGFLRGFVIPEGEHELHLYYNKSAFRLGAGISIGTFLISLGLIAFGMFFKKRV